MAFVKRHGTITFIDGGGTNLYALTAIDIGTFSATGHEEGQRAGVPILNRGSFAGYVEGDDTPLSISLSCRAARATFTKADEDRLLDIIYKTGNQSSATTDNPIATGPWALRMKIEYTDGTATASLTYKKLRLTADVDESGDTVVINISGTAYGAPTVV